MLLHRMALVSVRLFCRNLGNLEEFFGQMVYRPPPLAKNCPYDYVEVRHSIEIKRQIKRVSTYFEAYIIVRAAFHTLPLFYLRTQVLRTCARKNYVTVDTSYIKYL